MDIRFPADAATTEVIDPVTLGLPDVMTFGLSGSMEAPGSAVTLGLPDVLSLGVDMGESLGTQTPVTLGLPDTIALGADVQPASVDVPDPVTLGLPETLNIGMTVLQSGQIITPRRLGLPDTIALGTSVQDVNLKTVKRLTLPGTITLGADVQDAAPDVPDPLTLTIPGTIDLGASVLSVTPDVQQEPYVEQEFGVYESTPYHFSLVMEHDGSTDTFEVALWDGTAESDVARASYTWATDTAAVESSTVGSNASVDVVELGTGPNTGTLIRFHLTVTPDNVGNDASVRIYPAGASVSATGGTILHHAQVSRGGDPEGYVFTTDSAQTDVSAGRIEVDEMVSGMIAWRDNLGLGRLAVGTRCSLFVYVDGSLADITPAGFECGLLKTEAETGQYGSGLYGAGLYGEGDGSSETLVEAQSWQMDTFGQFLVAMAYSDGNLYKWELDDQSPAAIITNAPTDNLGMVVTPERFLVALGADGDGRLVKWADQQSLTDWTSTAENQAGDFPLAGQGALMAGRRGRGETLLWTDKSLWSMQFIGGTLVYSFREVGSECGPISRRAMSVVGGGMALWMGRRNFFVYDGHVRPLPSEVGDYVFSDLNRLQSSQIHAVSLSEFNEVWWFYPSLSSEFVDRYVSYNYVEDTWSFGTVARTAGADRGVFPRPLMADRYGIVYEHEQSDKAPTDLVGEEIAVYADGGLMELGRGDQRMWVMGYIPDQDTLGQLGARIAAAGYPTEEETVFGPFSARNPTSMRISGRQVRLRVDQLEPGWRLGRPRLDVTPAERR